MSDLGKISKIPLSNTNNAATGTVVRQHTSKSTTYAQTQGYFRISGKNYISYNIGHSGELWQYDDPQDTAPTYRSITSNEATLEFASHPFKVGDTVTVENVATAFNGTFTVSSVSATSITYAKTNANIARVATTGNVYNSNSTMLSANINGNGNAIRGMAPSLDNSKIYFADPTKKILKYDFSNGQITAAASLVGINYAPDDVALLGDGSFIMSAFGTGGYLWHVANDGTPLQRIRVFTSTTISNGYDLRIAPDGSAIYLAAQSSGFLKIPLNPPLAGRNYGVSTAIEPPAGTPKVVTNTPANVVSTSVDNVSFSSADMKGSVNANGTTSTAYFKYSTSPEFPSGSTVTTSSTAVTGSSDTPITKSINTLTPATTYYYKLVVETGSTLVEGAVRSFATLTPPSVTSATVTAGPAIGGTAVTLTGQGLATPTSVKVGNTVLNTFTASSTQVQLTTPPQTGTNISVTTSNGVAVSTFNYDSPTVVSVSSATGVAGDRLTLRGLNLTGVTGVTVNGVTMSGLTFVSDTEVSALVPSGTGTNLNIVLSTPSGSVTKAAAFSYSQTPQQSNGSGPSLQLSTPIVTGANKKYLFTKQAYTVTLIGTNMSSLFSLNVANRLATLVSSTSNSATIQIRKQIRPGVYDLQANYAAGQSVISGAFEFFEKPNAVYRRNDSDSDLKYVVNRAKSILKTNKAITKLICVSRPAVSGMNAARRFDTKKLGASCSELAKLLPDPKQLVVIRAGVKAAALPRGSLYISFE
jgi:hypothetical protein